MGNLLQWIWEVYEYISMIFFIPIAFLVYSMSKGLKQVADEKLRLWHEVRELKEKIEKTKEEA